MGECPLLQVNLQVPHMYCGQTASELTVNKAQLMGLSVTLLSYNIFVVLCIAVSGTWSGCFLGGVRQGLDSL